MDEVFGFNLQSLKSIANSTQQWILILSFMTYEPNDPIVSLLNVTESPRVRERFAAEFPKPVFPKAALMHALPLTRDYGPIGTAFDYLLRFKIQFLNKEWNVYTQQWVAETGYRIIRARSSFYKE